MFHPSPRIGFLAALRVAEDKRPALEQTLADARSSGDAGAVTRAEAALAVNGLVRGNNRFDFAVTGLFLAMALVLTVVSAWVWIGLLRGTRSTVLSETEVVWLPSHAFRERGPSVALGATALTLALLREWSGEAAVERARVRACACDPAGSRVAVVLDLPEVREAVERGQRERAYVEAAGQRFEGIQRCC